MGERPTTSREGVVIAVDRSPMPRVPGAVGVTGNVLCAATLDEVRRVLAGREADVVLSDMAPDTSGERETDHVRSVGLARAAAAFADGVLTNGGTLVVKLFRGGEEAAWRRELAATYVRVRTVKPAASRPGSREVFYVATGFVPAELRGG
ncbi:hypothetical protein BU14_0448s0001 [Porphyra umbilicalis]|uniref:rRNA methyltransferase 2, mitochondrial n=1 Tax=Porphyra umbilicalis TaxID=2786 RepID=A0A1X6NVA4_PORUM|nr:hypothetical protein BU14_0448s0001 [Porphyra umbilicalis]|eukprot:OSX72303.1 hypothetical protein BU14_0448s0001 [Porphyra umbilicalis]